MVRRSPATPLMPPLSKELQDLIANHFDSVESLEIVSLLQRSPNTFWSVAAVGKQLGLAEEMVARRVATLVESGILVTAEQTPAFRFAPKDRAVEENIATLVAMYGRASDRDAQRAMADKGRIDSAPREVRPRES